jgi:hypothetical protein
MLNTNQLLWNTSRGTTFCLRSVSCVQSYICLYIGNQFFFFGLCLVSKVTYVSRLGTSFFCLCLVSRVTYFSRLGTIFFCLCLVSRVTYFSRFGTLFLSSVCFLCPELHMSLDWEPVFLSSVCVLCPELHMSLDWEPFFLSLVCVLFPELHMSLYWEPFFFFGLCHVSRVTYVYWLGTTFCLRSVSCVQSYICL